MFEDVNPELTCYEVLQGDGETWEVIGLGTRGRWLHDTLDEAMEVAKEREADGHMVWVRPVYISWYGARSIGRTIYRTEKERKKHDGKVQKA